MIICRWLDAEVTLLYKLNVRHYRLRPPKGFESQHPTRPIPEISVTLCNQIIKRFTLAGGHLFLIGLIGVGRGQRCCVSPTFIDSPPACRDAE